MSCLPLPSLQRLSLSSVNSQRQMLYLVPKAAVTKCHKLGGFKQQKSVLTVLEARCPKSRCWPCHVLSKPPGEDPSFLFLASGDFQQSLVFLGLWQHHSNFCLNLHMALFPVWNICIQISLPYMDTSHWIRAHPNLVCPHFHLIMSKKTLFPNSTFQVLEVRTSA